MRKAAFLCNNKRNFERVYAMGRREKVASLVDLYPERVTVKNFEQHAENLSEVEVIFSTWGMPSLKPEQLEKLPNLQAVFYAAGTVKGFAQPLLEHDITVVSAWAANAVPVAEWTLSQILLSTKGFFRNARTLNREDHPRWGQCPSGPGNFAETVAIIAAGQIGRKVIDLLQPFDVDVLVVDPYLPDAQADAMGVRKVTLEEAFQEALVVSNHLPNLPSTQDMIERRHFASMREGATFINTGRGAQVVEDDLISVLQQRRDLTALLDVTNPEPPVEGSPLYTMENIILSSHIAGSIGNEVVRMADYMIEEFQRWDAGQDLRYAVSLEMLATMA
ncbi:MAG: hydroxyacid dehydrogenase [Phycisphaerae bacterium]